MTVGPGLTETAHAKVNLYLHVVGRRDDGYHLLDSLAVFAGAHDRLRAEPRDAPGLTLSLDGDFATTLAGEDPAANLVMRAAQALLPDDGAAGLALHLHKTLPVASGIGGGSADAAAALRLVARLLSHTGRAPSPAELATLAERLGADVPVCLAQQPARMQGVGEILLPAPALPPCAMLLVNCGVAVSTPAVFRARSPGFRPAATLPDTWPDAGAMAADLSRLHNDLEPPAKALCPPIAAVLDAIAASPGCLLARMSGSGATCFGLFAEAGAAALAEAALRRPGWWVWSGPLLSPSA